MPISARITTTAAGLAFFLHSHSALAHGVAGARFFPATIVTEDPFVADELSLPTVSTARSAPEGDSQGAQETEVSVEISKRITKNFGLGIGTSWININPQDSSAESGFGNLELSAKYLLLRSDPREFLLSIGLDAEIGGTGNARVEADRFSTLTPTLFFGKGMGDLPDSLKYLKPFAITGSVGFSFPTANSSTNDAGDVEHHSRAFEAGLVIEYSLPYLQSAVHNIGLGQTLGRLVPLVELSLSTALNGEARGETVGTVNPGVLWVGRRFQVGAEAIVPINSRSGQNVGAVVQLHFFLDDLFPKTIGKPLLD